MLYEVKKSKVSVRDISVWITVGFFLIFIAIFPQIVHKVSSLFLFETSSNFIFFLIIGLLMLLSFRMTIKVSNLEKRLTKLTQDIALKEKK